MDGDELLKDGLEEDSETIAKRVVDARALQTERFRDEGIFTNSQMNVEMIRRYCEIGEGEKKFLKNVIKSLNLSGRAYSRILKLSRTIADLSGNEKITLADISEAVQFRSLDRGTIND